MSCTLGCQRRLAWDKYMVSSELRELCVQCNLAETSLTSFQLFDQRGPTAPLPVLPSGTARQADLNEISITQKISSLTFCQLLH